MSILREKNVVELEVPMKDVMRMEVVDACQYLLDIEMGHIDGKSTGLVNFFLEVTRVDRLMIKQRLE